MESPNRRLIRPPLADMKKERMAAAPAARAANPAVKKQAPPDSTNAENFYYVKQMQTKTPLIVVLRDGETVSGVLEWYDKNCIKLTRDEGPNLLIYKSFIKYLYKAE